MKYLERFESLDESESHEGIIKDVFQDLIDEWSLEVLDRLEHVYHDGNYIRINHNKNGNYFIVNIFKATNRVRDFVFVSDGAEFKKDVSDHIERLVRMGYRISTEKVISDYHHIKISYDI